MPPPTQPPTAVDLLNDPTVLAAMAQAWIDSLPADPQLRHEEGGWVYTDLSTGATTTARAPSGLQSVLDLGDPPLFPGAVVVGTFHTHPNPMSEGWDPKPSATDTASANFSGVPWLILAEDGYHWTGPPSRRNGLGGGPGYPP
jgi:hypothetical protein